MEKRVWAFFNFGILSFSVWAQDHPLETPEGVSEYSISEKYNKEAQLKILQQSPRDFCRQQMMQRFLNANKVQFGRDDSLKDLEDKVNTKITFDGFDSPRPPNHDSWNLAMMSTAMSRKIGSYTPDWFRTRDHAPFLWPENHLRSLSDWKSDDSKVSKYLESVSEMKISERPSNDKIWAICLIEMPLSPFACAKAMNIILDRMLPVNNNSMVTTNLEGWKTLYSTQKFNHGLLLAAQLVEGKARGDPIKSEDNIVTDLENSFLKSGLSQEDAQEGTWLVLGAMASHGPNTAEWVEEIGFSDMNENGFNPISAKGEALSLIAAALPYLDYLKLNQSQSMYSYPSAVKISCDTGKPHHFWMSAYLARILVKEYHLDPELAAKAVYLSEKAYQMKRNVGLSRRRKNQSASIFVRDGFDPVSNIMRADLAHAAGGSQWGANSSHDFSKAAVSVDGALFESMKNSVIPSPINAEVANSLGYLDVYRRFNKVFAPDATFKGIKQ